MLMWNEEELENNQVKMKGCLERKEFTLFVVENVFGERIFVLVYQCRVNHWCFLLLLSLYRYCSNTLSIDDGMEQEYLKYINKYIDFFSTYSNKLHTGTEIKTFNPK